jgi:hypothetical protein
MFKNYLLAALHLGVVGQDDDLARAQLKRADWVLRPALRRRFENVLMQATNTATGGGAEHPSPSVGPYWAAGPGPDAVTHCLKLATLLLQRRKVADPSSKTEVDQAYESLAVPQPPRWPLWTTLTTIGIIGLIGWIAILIATRPGPGRKSFTRENRVPVAGAYQTGGVPLADQELATLLTQQLPALVVATDRVVNGGLAHEAQRRQMIEDLQVHPWMVAHGGAVLTAWQELLTAYSVWAMMDADAQSKLNAASGFIGKARQFSDQLAGLGRAYYVEGDGFGSGQSYHGVLYSYRVEYIAFEDAQGDQQRSRRVLSLRRIDRLNLQRSLLGMESATLGDPIVLLDQIESHVATKVLPVLADNEPYDIGDDDFAQTQHGQELRAFAGAAVRREFLAVLGDDAQRAAKVAALLRERSDLLAAVAKQMSGRGFSMNLPDTVFLPESFLDALDNSIAIAQGDRLTEIESALARHDAAQIAASIEDVVIATVRRHEAQHGFDESDELRYPKIVAQYVGPRSSNDRENRHGISTNAELSAYLSAIASDPRTPRFSYWSLSKHAFDKDSWGTAESYVAVLLTQEIADKLGIVSNGPIIHDGEIDRVRLSATATSIASKSDDELRTAAAGAWTSLYGKSYMRIVDRVVSQPHTKN